MRRIFAALSFLAFPSLAYAWTPANIMNQLLLWYDATDTTTFSFIYSSRVMSWTDKKSGIKVLGTEGTRPLYEGIGLNGHPDVMADGTRCLISDNATGSISISPTWDAYFMSIITSTGSTTGFNVLLQGEDPAPKQDADFAFFGNDPPRKWMAAGYDIEGGWTEVFVLGSVPPSLGIAHLLESYRSTTRIATGYDAANWLSNPLHPGTASTVPVQISMFGADYPTRCKYGYIGKLSEAIVTNKNLSSSYTAPYGDRERMEGYLAWKYGTRVRLPANHPYKNMAP